MDALWDVLMRMLVVICDNENVAPPALVLDRRRLRPSRASIGRAPDSPTSSCGATSFPEGHVPTIEIQVGKDHLDLILVLLHEAGHVLERPTRDTLGRVRAHTPRFFVRVGALYRDWGVPLSYAIWRETQYCPGAVRYIKRGYLS